jgi:GT2 family glycosyltransferase
MIHFIKNKIRALALFLKYQNYIKAFKLINKIGLIDALRYIKFQLRSGSIKEYGDYSEWIKLCDTFKKYDKELAKKQIKKFKFNPLISIVMPTYNSNQYWLVEAIESVRNQIYPNWELCIADDASTDKNITEILDGYAKRDPRIKVVFRKENGHISIASNTALKITSGDWVTFLDHDDLLSNDALFWIARTINSHPSSRMIYSDEDKIDLNGHRTLPFFKPSWSPHLMFSQAYLGHLISYEKKLIDSVGGFDDDLRGAQDYGLALACSANIKPDQIRHIPHILYHWRLHPNSTAQNSSSKPYADEAGRIAVEKHTKKVYSNLNIEVVNNKDLFTYNLKFNLPGGLKISIIIPTKDGLKFLRDCIESIINNSSWCNYEIIILNNNSKKSETIKYLDDLKKTEIRVKVLDLPTPFNWSKLNNIGAKYAAGDVFIFLNNDTKIISNAWMESLAGYANLPEVGCVGGLLLYEDSSIQHGGIVLGMNGYADHLYKGMDPNHSGSGPFISQALTKNTLAVTGACLAISREKFHFLKGFDESFVVCGSDVELGIRAHKKGLFNVICSEAKLFHYESKTRSNKIPSIDFIQSKKKYEPYLSKEKDPFFNPNLSLKFTKPTLNFVDFNHVRLLDD